MEKYPVSAEQYLIREYEKVLVANDLLTKDKAELLELVAQYEGTLSAADLAANADKLVALPILKAHHTSRVKYEYSAYNLTPDKFEKLTKYIQAIKATPELALREQAVGNVSVLALNVKLEIFGLVTYAHAYISNNNLDLILVNTPVEFETAYTEYLAELTGIVDSWHDKYHQRWLDSQTKEEKANEIF